MVLVMGVRVPVFATSQELPGSTGIVDASDSGLFQYRTSLTSNTWANFFEDGYPTTFTLGDDGSYIFNSGAKSAYQARVRSDQYIEFVFSVAQSGTLVFDGTNYIYTYMKQGSSFQAEDINTGGPLEILVDDVVVQSFSDNTTEFTSGSYPITNRFSIRVSSGSENLTLFTGGAMVSAYVEVMLNGYVTSDSGTTDPTDPTDATDPSSPSTGGSTDLSGVIEEIEIVQGTLVDIDGKLEYIQESVTEIETTVKDTHDQLEDPDSNIWQAAGSAISDAVTGLFVPEQAELDAKLDEIETIVIDKLGDTYTVIERVDEYEDQLVGGFIGGGRQYNFHFPGISVPLPDGTVTILPAQDVSIENDAFIVFRDLLGTGVALLCGFAAVHIAHDFVICIISGVSYWGFIRGRHNE